MSCYCLTKKLWPSAHLYQRRSFYFMQVTWKVGQSKQGRKGLNKAAKSTFPGLLRFKQACLPYLQWKGYHFCKCNRSPLSVAVQYPKSIRVISRLSRSLIIAPQKKWYSHWLANCTFRFHCDVDVKTPELTSSLLEIHSIN